MAETTLGGQAVHTNGELPEVGGAAPPFTLTGRDLSPVSLADLAGTQVVLNIFPSIDTAVCATSVRTFNAKAGGLEGTVVLNVSADLPFAASRFCGAEGLDGVEVASTFRSPEFFDGYGVQMVDGKLAGLCARSVVVVDAGGQVVHTELVPDIAQEPDYDAALAALS